MISLEGTSISSPPLRLFSRQPPGVSVSTQGRHVLHPAVLETLPVQMAAVVGRVARDELRPPDGTEAVQMVADAQAGEFGVDEDQLVADPVHLVDGDVAGGMREAGQETAIVLARWFQFGGHGGQIVELPDFQRRADRQPVALHRQPHRYVEAAEVRVQHVAVGAQHDQFAGLIRRDQHGEVQFPQQRGKIARVDAAERSGPFGSSRFGACGWWLR